MPVSATAGTSGTDRATAVRAEGVRVRLGGATILWDVDLTVPRGEVVALLGANGSGKSTLVRALVGAVPLASGTVELLGRPLGRSVPWARVGYVPQRVTAGGGVPATALEVALSGALHGRRLLPGRGARARAREALALVGLADRADAPVRTLSGGQQQRVLIARALVRRPDLLVLDEPMAGVDVASQHAFGDLVGRLVEAGTTLLVVLHELGPLAPHIGRAVVLRHGSVVHDGAPPPPHADHAAPDHVHLHPHDDEHELGDAVAPTVRIEP